MDDHPGSLVDNEQIPIFIDDILRIEFLSLETGLRRDRSRINPQFLVFFVFYKEFDTISFLDLVLIVLPFPVDLHGIFAIEAVDEAQCRIGQEFFEEFIQTLIGIVGRDSKLFHLFDFIKIYHSYSNVSTNTLDDH